MAATMGDYWTTFARNGDPNGESSAGEWAKWTPGGEEYLELNVPVIAKAKLVSDTCDFHDSMLGYS